MLSAQLSKEKGNDAFKDGNYLLAQRLYTNAISADPSEYSYPLNRALVNLKLQRWSEAELDATIALGLLLSRNCEGLNVKLKAYLRRCIARQKQRDFVGAWQDIRAFSGIGGDGSVVVEQSVLIAAAKSSSQPQPSSSSGSAPHNPTPDPLGFVVRDALGKGLGAFSSQIFHRGDRILAEHPLYTVNNPDKRGLTFAHNIITAVQQLSEVDTESFLSLSSCGTTGHISSPIVDRHVLNAIAVEDNMSALFIVASRFNHSCSPNARYSWHAGTGQLRIFALCDIAVQKEICVSYIVARDVYGSCRKDRKNRLNDYAFSCVCIACTLPDLEGRVSDARRMEIARIWESVPYYSPSRTADRLRAIVRAIRLLQEEGYWADADDFTNDAAAMCAYHSDWESTAYWATKTYETRVAESGKDSRRVAEVQPVYLDPRNFRGVATLWTKKFNIRL